jgi:hypothetical protein
MRVRFDDLDGHFDSWEALEAYLHEDLPVTPFGTSRDDDEPDWEEQKAGRDYWDKID